MTDAELAAWRAGAEAMRRVAAERAARADEAAEVLWGKKETSDA